ncbi:MAG: DUF2203 domain-containing protein [Actinobacteria bacterium]|nr:DUF2203 domain-containing protein [Actinomycetota bacterium]
MPNKTYSVQEANDLLPYLAPTLVELRDKFEDAIVIRTTMQNAAATNGGSVKRERWSRTLARVAELVERIEEWELELRDISVGLIDFPTVIDGREAWLCWRLGEAEVAYWHSPDDGFAGRRPLGG